MTETQAVAASTVGGVADDEGNLKRSIQMKNFASSKIKKKALSTDEHDRYLHPQGIACGQMIGQIWDVKEKVGTLPDGTAKMSLLAIGEFEGMSYETGEVFTSTAAYLPGYYLETIKSMLDRGANAIAFAIEIILVPTGKGVPLAYEVKNLIRRRPDNPLNVLKQQMAAANRLRLPPPAPPSEPMEGEVLSITSETPVAAITHVADDEPVGADEPAPEAKRQEGVVPVFNPNAETTESAVSHRKAKASVA